MDYEEILEEQIDELEDYEQDLEREIADRIKNAKKYLEKYRIQQKKAKENVKEARQLCKVLEKEEKRLKNELQIVKVKLEKASYKCIMFLEDREALSPVAELIKIKSRLKQANEVKANVQIALDVHLDQ